MNIKNTTMENRNSDAEKARLSLFGTQFVLGMHDDCEIIDEVEVGFSETFELVIRLKRTCYGWVAEDFEDTTCWIDAYLGREEAYRVSRRMGVQLTDMPGYMAKQAGDYGENEMRVTPQMCWETFNELCAMLEGNGATPAIRYRHARLSNGRSFIPWH
ncbi:MAG: hypothetical protein J1E29_07035 [Duncaniella sp.]|nr:hypothetical protein [Duncaniella sp.]